MCLSVIKRNNNLYTYNSYVERSQTKKEQENPTIIYYTAVTEQFL